MAETTEELRQEIAETRAELGERIDQFTARAEQVIDVRHHVRRRPWSSLALAATLGFVLGRSERRRNGAPPAVPEADGHGRFGTWLTEEFDLLATAAGMTAIGFLRNAIQREAPSLASYLGKVVDEHRHRS